MKGNAFRALAALFLVLLVARMIGQVSGNFEDTQWDFKTYYFAAQAYGQGMDPYDPDSLAEVSGVPIVFRYVYTPGTLLFFRFFTLFPLETAYWLYFALKMCLLCGLMVLWARQFLAKEAGILFYLFCAVAFSGALWQDVLAGNISILEQFPLWLAFHFFLRRKTALFCVFIALAAVFKLTLALFLLLLLFRKGKERYVWAAVSVAIILVIALLPVVSSPRLLSSFLGNVGQLDERGAQFNPTTHAMMRDLFDTLDNAYKIGAPDSAPGLLHWLIAAGVLFATWKAVRRQGPDSDPRMGLFVWCVAFALIMTRFKVYSYMLLLVPTWYIIKRAQRTSAGLPLMMFSFIPGTQGALSFGPLGVLAVPYWPLMLAYGVWAVYIHDMLSTT